MDKNSLIEKHNDIYIIRQQMPYPLKENNAYLAESDDGWTVIDMGIDTPQTRELWEYALKAAGIIFSQIKKIIITHCHPDHLGAAAWMQEMTGAPVYMSGIDKEIAHTYVFLGDDKYCAYEKVIAEAALKADFGHDKIRRLVTDWCDNVLPYFPEPSLVKTFEDDEQVVLCGNRYSVRVLPGHTDGQVVLWCGENRILFSGDIFAETGYLHFTDWPNTRNENPLNDFLLSLTAIEEMDPVLIYTGHGRPVSSYAEIFSKIRYRHNKLSGIFEKAVTGPVTAGEIYGKIFPVPQTGEFADYIHHHRVLIGETAGYLNYLAGLGRLSVKTADGKKIYYPIAGK